MPHPHANCHGWPRAHEIGHWLAMWLEACCVTKKGVVAFKALLGLRPACRCVERTEWLNDKGKAVQLAIKR